MFCVSSSPSGQLLATAHVDGSVRMWDSSTLTLARLDDGRDVSESKLMTMLDEVGCVAWAPDSKRVVGGSFEGVISVWDAATGCELGRLSGHTEAVTSVVFSPNGLCIASGAFDSSLRLWDAAGGAYQELRVIEVEGQFNFVHSVAFSPCSTRVAAGLADNTARVWDPATGNELRRMGEHTSSVITVAFSPCGRWISSGSKDHSIRVWNAETGEVLRTLEDHGDHVMSVAYSLNDDGARLVSSASNVVRVWDMTSGLCILTLEGHTEDVTSVVFSQDGSHIFSVSFDLTIRKWSALRGGECEHVVDVLELDLARLVESIKNGVRTELDLSFSFLRDNHVSTIIETITARGCLLKSLTLRYCKLSGAAIMAIADALKVNESLQNVNLQGSPMGGPEHASLAAALQINYAVTTVTLGDGTSDSDQALITAALEANRNLTTREAKKEAFYLRLQREGVVPVSKPAGVVA